MKKPDKRSQQVLAAARKAITKITDPALRSKATAILHATQKKLVSSRQQQRFLASKRQRIRDRGRDLDLDFDR